MGQWLTLTGLYISLPWPAAYLLPVLQFPGAQAVAPTALTMATCWQGLWAYRSYLIVLFLPILLLPLPIFVPTKVRTWNSGHR